MRWYFVFAALLWLLMAASSSPGRDIFVSNLTGDDRRAGTLPLPQGELGPCLTIGKALRIALPGDQIVVENTGLPYRECLSIQGPRHSGTQAWPFRILGNGATLDGSVSLADAEWKFAGNDTFRTRPAFMSYQQLFLDDQPMTRVVVADGAPVSLQPLQWSLHEGWIYFRPEPGKLPHSYDLSCCSEKVGITLYEVHDVIVEDLVLRGYALDAVNCHDNTRRTYLRRLTCLDNGRSGISVGGSSHVRIDGSTAAGNGEAQFRMEGYCTVGLVNNEFDPTTAPAVDQAGGRILP